MLPTHYVIEPAAARPRRSRWTGARLPGDVSLSVGDLVTLRSFAQSERRADGHSLSLRGAAQPGQPPLRAALAER